MRKTLRNLFTSNQCRNLTKVVEEIDRVSFIIPSSTEREDTIGSKFEASFLTGKKSPFL